MALEAESQNSLICNFPPTAYPRYRYFQKYLGRAVKRFSNIIGQGKFAECTSKGMHYFKEIVDLADLFKGDIFVLMFAEDASQQIKCHELIIEKSTIEIKGTNTSLSSCIAETRKLSVLHPTALLYVGDKKKKFLDMVSKFSQLNEEEKGFLIFCCQQDKFAYSYNDLNTVNFNLEELPALPLNKVIQKAFEAKIIAIFEKMLVFIKDFVPRHTKGFSEILLERVTQKLIKSLGDTYVILDLSPSAKLSQTEKDITFKRLLIEHIVNTTRAVMVDSIFQQYGISLKISNELLNYGNYDNEMQKVLQKLSFPVWPEDNDGVSTCKTFRFEVIRSIPEVVNQMEDLVQKKLQVMNVVRKLQFELFGILKMTEVKLSISIPSSPKLPLKMQRELLEIPEVFGCGTLFGQLMVHMKATLFPYQKEQIKQILQKYHYSFGYTYAEWVDFKPKTLYMQGNEIRATPTRTMQASEMGTLGCFVKIRRDASTSHGEVTDELHGVTCAHCLLNGCQEVQAKLEPLSDYNTLGVKGYSVHRAKLVDVATFMVLTDKLEQCNPALKHPYYFREFSWYVFDDNIDNLMYHPVYKIGASSTTYGFVTSIDYMLQENSAEVNTDSELANLRIILTSSEIDESETPFSEDGDSGAVVCLNSPDVSSVAVLSILHGEIMSPQYGSVGLSGVMKECLTYLQRQYNCQITPALPSKHQQAVGGAVGFEH